MEMELKKILFNSGFTEFIRNIRLGKFERSYEVAKKTVLLLNNLVKSQSWPTALHLIEALGKICEYVDTLDLVETSVANMIRRVMRIVREECHNLKTQDQTTNHQPDEQLSALDLPMTALRENLLEAIEQELINELDMSTNTISTQALDYIQTDETILTLGKSKVIESFLKYAANSSISRKFVVVVVSLAPFYSGHELAKKLIKYKIETIIIPDSAVFAIMSRVNKVILGTHSMMANGGLKAPAGAHSIALAAKHYSVPLIVCCPLYKLTPQYLVSHDSEAFRRFSHLHSTVPEPYVSKEVKEGEANSSNSVQSIHSRFDYVPPDLITLFVSNMGGNSPSYVYQLLEELYSKSDYLKLSA